MRKSMYLLVACCIFIIGALPATAGPGCCKQEKKCEKKVEALCLTLDELEDGKTIDVGEEGTLTMKQDGDAWTLTLTDEAGKENTICTLTAEGEEPTVVKIVTTSDGSDTWTSVTTGEEALEGGHKAIFIGDGGEHGKHCNVWVSGEGHGDKKCNVFVSGDDKAVCKQFETVHCGTAYTCEKCGLTISVPGEKDKGAYKCPNDDSEMKKCDRPKEVKKQYAYKVVTVEEGDTDTDIEKEVEVEVE